MRLFESLNDDGHGRFIPNSFELFFVFWMQKIDQLLIDSVRIGSTTQNRLNTLPEFENVY